MSNFKCHICYSVEPKWICKCSDILLCQEHVADHLSKPAPAHPLVAFDPRNVEIPGMKSVQEMLEVVPYLDREIQKVQLKRDVIKVAIQKKCQDISAEISAICREKLDEVDLVAEQLIEKIHALKTVSQKEKLKDLKRSDTCLVSFDCVFSKVKISDFVKIDSDFLVCFSEPICIQLATINPKEWWSCTSGVDAITFNFSRPVKFCGVSIGKQQSTSSPVALESLQVLEGRSTQGRVMYTHPRVCPMNSDTPDRVDIRLNCPVKMLAKLNYTVKAVLRGGQVRCTGKLAAESTQGDVRLMIDSTHFAGEDQNNGSNSDSGIFFSLSYQI